MIRVSIGLTCGCLLLLTSLACGETSPSPSNSVQARRMADLAEQFVGGLVRAKRLASATRNERRLVEPAVDISDLFSQMHINSMLPVAGPRPGCSTIPKEVPIDQSRPCFEVALVGKPVTRRVNKGYASILYGIVYISVSSNAHPRVHQYAYAGGVRFCKLDSNCASAHRSVVALAQRWRLLT